MVDKMSEKDSKNSLVDIIWDGIKKIGKVGGIIGALTVPTLNCVPEEQHFFSSGFPASKEYEEEWYHQMTDVPSLTEADSAAYEGLGFARGDIRIKKKLRGRQIVGKLKRTPSGNYGPNAITRCIPLIGSDYDRTVSVTIEKRRDFNILHYILEGDRTSFLTAVYCPTWDGGKERNVLLYTRFDTKNGRVKRPLPHDYQPRRGTHHLSWEAIISLDSTLRAELEASIFSEEDIAEANYHRFPDLFINGTNSELDELKLEGDRAELLKLKNQVLRARKFEKLVSHYNRVTQVPHRDPEVNEKVDAIKQRLNKAYNGLFKIYEYSRRERKDQIERVINSVENYLK